MRPPSDLRSALVRVKKRLPPSNMSGLEDALGHEGEAPSDSTWLLLMTTQISGAGTQAEKVAMGSVGRIRLSRAPHVKYKYLLFGGVRSMDEALEYFRRAAKRSDDPLVRAVASAREFICEALRILFTPYAPPSKSLAPPSIRPEGLIQTLAALRTLSRMVKDAARAETPFLRVCDACYGYLLKYNMPVSKGPQDVAVAPQPAPRREAPSAPQSTDAVEAKPAGRTGDRSRPRSPRASRKKRGGQKRRRPRSPRRRPQAPASDQMADKSAYEERMGFSLAGEDSKGSLRDKCKNCYIGLGARAQARRSLAPGSG